MRTNHRPRSGSRSRLRPGAITLATLVAGCAAEPPSAPAPTDDDPATMTLRTYELQVMDPAVLEALAGAEVAFQGPITDAVGAQYIRLLGSRELAESIAGPGLVLRGVVPATGAAARDADFAAAAAAACPATMTCALPVGSPFFMKYGDITAEMAALDAASSSTTTAAIGNAFTTNTKIMAIQFGATEDFDATPTLYVLGTYHAREWIGTAVTLQLMRWIDEVKRFGTVDGAADPTLVHDLAYANVVLVPVVNPDGYERTRDSYPATRTWRGNTNTSSCSGGVDLNRNHTTGWGPPAPPTTGCAGINTQFRGTGPSSEPETKAIETLLTGTAFPNPQTPVAVISYHAYGDFVIYPEGYKEKTNSAGPKCHGAQGANCFNADFTVLRDLFGDTHSSLFVDRTSDPSIAFPYYRDHGRTLLYDTSGDVGVQAMYGPVPMEAISPELPSSCYGFLIECVADAESIIKQAAMDQLDVIRRVVARAPGLASTDIDEAYAPNAVGALSSGMWTREYLDAADADAARATFVKSVWQPVSTGSLTATIDGTNYSYARGRSAAQYDLYRLELAKEGLDPLCLPCEVSTTTGEGQSDTAVDCSGCIKLCDPDRLSAAGWEMHAGDRGGVPDCWWSPYKENGELVMPGGGLPADATHCHFTFSAEWGDVPSGGIAVERFTTFGWETVMTLRYQAPYPFAALDRLVSYAYEADNLFYAGQAPAFRFRMLGPMSDYKRLKIFDPVTYCRKGPLH
jgi:hypothetical protein